MEINLTPHDAASHDRRARLVAAVAVALAATLAAVGLELPLASHFWS
ncbi:MAG: hypothetical protein GXY03_15755 [Solirubrobacterales bacterium]|nr:hypothetical protein [Solirubrobacterales bacterium]